MKKHLPKITKSSEGFTLISKAFKGSYGFTLIEILVVISIIAILAVIGVSVFSGAQGSARDGRRRSEVSSLSKSIESAKNFEDNTYTYATADFNKDFPKGISDPQTGTQEYCLLINTNVVKAPDIPTANTLDTSKCVTMTCPTTTVPSASSCATSVVTATGLSTALSGAKAWTLCAGLERGSKPSCVQSLQK